MNARTAKFCVGQGLVNIKRNKLFSIASMCTIAACIFLISVIFSIIINVNYIEKQVEQNLGVTVFFDNGLSQEGIDEIGEIIKADKRVEKCEYTSAEEAWKSFKENYLADAGDDVAKAFANDNPLANSASYTVFLKTIEEQDTFVTSLKKVEGVRDVKHFQQAKETLSKISRLLCVHCSHNYHAGCRHIPHKQYGYDWYFGKTAGDKDYEADRFYQRICPRAIYY